MSLEGRPQGAALPIVNRFGQETELERGVHKGAHEGCPYQLSIVV